MQYPFTISQELSFKEYFRLSLHFFLFQKMVLRFFLIMFALMTLSTVLGVTTTSKKADILEILRPLLTITGMIAILIAFTFFYCLWSYKTKPGAFRNVSFTFTDWGVLRQDEQTKVPTRWGSFSKAKETDSHFLLYFAKMDVHIIQKKMFLTENDLVEFRKMIQENMPLDARIEAN